MKAVVTVSSYWNNPKILTKVDIQDICLSMELDDFISALKREIVLDEFMSAIKKGIGSVTWTFKDDTFEKQFNAAVATALKDNKFGKQVDEAVRTVIEKIKEESIKVV